MKHYLFVSYMTVRNGYLMNGDAVMSVEDASLDSIRVFITKRMEEKYPDNKFQNTVIRSLTFLTEGQYLMLSGKNEQKQ